MGHNWIYFLAMASSQSGQKPNETGQLLTTLLMMGFFVLFMWLFLFRPQQKKAKEHAALISTVKAGDCIVTNAGIVGVVISVKEKTLAIRSGDAKMEITQASVADILERGGSKTEQLSK